MLILALFACTAAPPPPPTPRGPLPPLTIAYSARGEGEIAPCG